MFGLFADTLKSGSDESLDSQDFSLIEMLGLIYEDLDIDNVEERFIELVDEMFSFDRIALFFVKHKRGILQGKLSKGFSDGIIESLKISVKEDCLFSRPLISGFPVWQAEVTGDQYQEQLGLKEFALIPVINKKRIPCWKVKKCQAVNCPAYGKKWLRCWMVSGTQCSGGIEVSQQAKSRECMKCPIFANQDAEAVEGVLLVDNSSSMKKIGKETIAALSIIAHSVGVAINNSKTYMRTLSDAIRDELTGLHNRRYFNERLLDEVDRAKRYDGKLSLIMCDVDHFKRVNDTFGHPVGDEVLIWFGDLINHNHRKSDVVARYGGEEFAVLLLNTDKRKALEIAENMRRDIESAKCCHENHDIRLTASFGVATYGPDAGSFEGLVSKADEFLYAAKVQGRNRVCSS
ncbi:MAG: GGDEF domain-containing protein [Proteobacteria bacterium]|nr:GGDEF domain-containing protein [Pseudomonadota bacterium]MBU1710205.1 GGDEF domain-containing protein [Pseudomonadota bacterium]